MQITITTPGLLFPAISLLLLAYTNRFLVIAQLIRELRKRIDQGKACNTKRQITNLRKRVNLIRSMQWFGVFSFLLCTFSMIAILLEYYGVGEILFGLSLAFITLSLLCSLWEIQISGEALNIELEGME
ncbi:DUF2721 domain-containing protein [Zooshikella marina]|uniref:DUF2721 domain-containing protein n=1 Tax=Zooshikella ganghwensis TaxID=202772 RepID=UPI00040C6020|nr:DUF2721 domain-containing protein [Zooshikella ganghwensis]MBU2704927.1 DUF2721 domain-containing protein [Zooshikella ganghwensis]